VITIIGVLALALILVSPILLPAAYEVYRDRKATKWADEALQRQRDEEHRRHAAWRNRVEVTINAPRVHNELLSDEKVSIDELKDGKSLTISIKQKDNLNCPLCLDRVSADVIMCCNCNTLSHYECVQELGAGKCPVLGCRAALTHEISIPSAEAAKQWAFRNRA